MVKTSRNSAVKNIKTIIILILLNKNGEEVFRYIGKNNSDRFSFDQLKAKIVELDGLK